MKAPDLTKSSWFKFLFLRSVPAIIWVVLIVMLGLFAYFSMIKESLPDLEIPEASIITRWPGATPQMVEKKITHPIEKNLRGMKGLESVHSSSFDETSIIAVRFKAECRLDPSMQLLKRKIDQIQALLPRSAKLPRIEETSVRDLPIASFALLGRSSQKDIQNLASELKKELEKIPGIKKAVLSGDQQEIIKVQLYTSRLKSLNIPSSLVRDRIINHNYDAPWGNFESLGFKFRLKMSGAFRDLWDLKNLPIIRLPQGRIIRLKDVAQVKQGFMKKKTQVALSWRGEIFTPTLAIELFKSQGHDTLKLVESAKKTIANAQKQSTWPKAMQCRLVGDDSKVIADELDRGFNNGWQAMFFVFAVLLVMLTWREAMVAALLVPLTLLGSLAVLWALGFTFNLLVIVGMILALGLLVDDFILILEGLHEGIFLKGKSYVQSIGYTLGTFAFPSLSGSVTTVLVLLPLAFVGGVDGKFIRLIPITAAICLVVSYLLSIILAPPLAKLAFSNKSKSKPGTMDRISEKAGTSLAFWLKKNVLKNRFTSFLWIGFATGAFVVSIWLFSHMNDTLYPKEDGRELGVMVLLPPETDLKHSSKVADALGKILQKKAYFEYVMKVVGKKPAFSISSFHDLMGPIENQNIIGFNCLFTPRKKREHLAHLYVEPLREELRRVLEHEPGARLFMSPKTGGSSGEDPLQIDIQGDDFKILRKIAQNIKLKLSQVYGVVDIRDNIGEIRTEARFRPIRESLDFHKVEQEEMATQVLAFMEREKVGMYQRPGTKDNLDIRLSAFWPSQKGEMAKGPSDLNELEKLFVINSQGQAISLWNLTEPIMGQAQGKIIHKQGKRSVTVMAKLNGRYVSEIINQLRPTFNEMQKSWPTGYEYVFAGEKKVTEDVYETMFKVFILAMILVYAILALLFDSLLQPVIILSTVLFALTGVFFGFFLTGQPFSFSAAIGIVALVGIVVNDAIVIVSTMNNHLRAGFSMTESALKGASDRLRPIVSTTVTNLFGLTPLALSDPGWAPLCLAIIYGEIVATIGALILVPALYVAITPNKKEVAI